MHKSDYRTRQSLFFLSFAAAPTLELHRPGEKHTGIPAKVWVIGAVFTQYLQNSRDFGKYAQIQTQDFVILTGRKDKISSCKIVRDVL
ncbi:MAG: hypothetical protein IJW77_04685 [Clostridia bacterium]|nr:hypothetical protein [Clostridia bacterium]